MRVTILILAYFFSGLFTARSTVTQTPEMGVINSMPFLFKTYKESYGNFPVSWEDLSRTVDLEKLNRGLRYRESYPIQDHYEFVAKALPAQDEEGRLNEGSQVLLIRTVPLENLSEPDRSKRKQWRYLVVRSKAGEITSIRLPEQDVQAMFKAAGVVITPKPSLPSVETDDVIPEREPKPKPNPNDVEYLKQYPELDPARNGTVPAQSSGSVSKPVKTPSQPAVAASVTETGANWWLIVSAFIVIIITGLVVFRLNRK